MVALVLSCGGRAAAEDAAIGLGRTTFYVSPNGNDSGPGTDDNPFRTLERARDAVRIVNDDMRRDIVVNVEGGTYFLTHPLELTAADSGTNGYSIVYRALPGEHAVISGGRKVIDWSLYDAAHGIYRAPVGDLKTRQLYVNGRRAVRARGPANPPGFTETDTGYTTSDTSMASWRDPSAVEVVSRASWKMFRCPIASIDGDTITMQQPCFHNANLQRGVDINAPAWIENAYELLDQPGEWYLDEREGFLYYIPNPGEDMSRADVVAPALESLVHGEGTLDEPLHDVRFEGVTFAHATWLAPSSPEGYADVQAGFRIVGDDNPDFDSTRTKWAKPPAPVTFKNAHDIALHRDTFTHIGSAGLSLETGTHDNRITGNRFEDISSSGLEIGGVEEVDHHPSDPRQIVRDNVVKDNVVTRTGVEYTDSVGLFVGYTTHTTVAHNELFDLPYTGMTVGWGWGLTDPGGNPAYPTNLKVPRYETPTTSADNEIRDNVISDAMKLQADGGGIYTLGASPGTVVEGNYIHDMSPNEFGAIYHDEGSRYYHTTQNVTCHTLPRWLLVNNARDNVATYNFSDNASTYTPLSTGLTVAHNTTVGDCDELPASIIDDAGLEPAYRDLRPRPTPADTTAPSAPADVTVSGRTSASVQLRWVPATDEVGVSGYEIARNGLVVGVAAPSDHPTYTISGLEPDTSYTLTLRARDAAANLSPEHSVTIATLPAPTVPADLPGDGLALWLSGDAMVSATDGKVSLWGDQSGAGHDAVQDAPSAQPTIVSGALNGKPVLRFDGTGDILATAEAATTSTHYSVFVVSTVNPKPAGPFYNGYSGGDGYGFYRFNPGNYGWLDGGVAALYFGSVASTGFQVQEAVRGDDGRLRYFIDGAGSGSPVADAPNPPSGATYVGGINAAPASNLFEGDVAEVILYDHALSDGERQEVERYLASKYGL